MNNPAELHELQSFGRVIGFILRIEVNKDVNFGVVEHSEKRRKHRVYLICYNKNGLLACLLAEECTAKDIVRSRPFCKIFPINVKYYTTQIMG